MQHPARHTAALRALCALGLHAEVLVPAVLEALHKVVPSARNLFDWTDEQGRLVRYFIEGPIDAVIAQRYFDEFHNRREGEAMPPFQALRRTPAGIRSAGELDHAAFYASALYNEIWQPQGFRYRMEAVLRGARGQLLGSLVLYRGPGEARFSAVDERQLAEVTPAFATALETCGPAGADDRHVVSPEAPQTVLMTLDGEVCHASDGAHRLLLLADGGVTRDRLTRPLDALGGGALAMLLARLREPRDALAPAPSITHENPWGQFVLSGVLLRPAAARNVVLAQVTITRLEPHRVALERALRALPVTPGQMAVCRELYRGLPQAEIGGRLGVAPATVVDHARKAYRALDVRSAQELRARLDALIAR